MGIIKIKIKLNLTYMCIMIKALWQRVPRWVEFLLLMSHVSGNELMEI